MPILSAIGWICLILVLLFQVPGVGVLLLFLTMAAVVAFFMGA